MGHIFDFNDARRYAAGTDRAENRPFIERENRLLAEMLRPKPGESILEIGSGTGSSLLPLVDAGLRITGLDASPYMIDIARQKTGPRVDYQRGFAEALPFDDNEFNHAIFMGSLEFVDDPQRALEEACRVAKDKVFIGVVNKFAIKGVALRIRGMFSESIYNHARFFSVWELKGMVHRALGDVPLSWKTICHVPGGGKAEPWLERISLLERCPFGGFTGMLIVLTPRFRTRPLDLDMAVRSKGPSGAVTG